MEPPPEPDGTPPEWEHLEDELRREAELDPRAGAESGPTSGPGQESAAATPDEGLGFGFRPEESGSREESSTDPLSLFPAEYERPRPIPFSLPLWSRRSWRPAGMAAVALVFVIFVAVRYRPAGSEPSPAVPPGTVVIESRPPAATVYVDGQPQGVTPQKLSLPAGTHVFAIQLGEARREVTRTVTSGAQIYEYLDLPQPVKTGQLSVVTNPPGARVIVDGTSRGVSPIELTGLATGTHRVTLQDGQNSVEQNVTIRAGMTAALVVPLAGKSRDFGYLSVTSAVPVEVFEDGNLLGSSQSERIMMQVGRHTIDIANDSLGFRIAERVTIAPGAVSKLPIELPNGTLSVNAMPWAEVWMDGRRVGETPIANLPASVGPHELVFRHPQLGEQRRSVTVTLKAPARVGVDLRQ